MPITIKLSKFTCSEHLSRQMFWLWIEKHAAQHKHKKVSQHHGIFLYSYKMLSYRINLF